MKVYFNGSCNICNAEISHYKKKTCNINYVDISKNKDELKITYKDEGKGISKENLPEIFEPFFTTKSVGEGTGLGLALSYEIIQQHSGDLTVESEEGQGATFTLTLPLTELNNNHRTKEEV